MFAEYVDWRAQHPSDDLMTELLTAEFEDETGMTRRLTREEILTYIMLLAGAGQRDDHSPHRLGRQAASRAPRPTCEPWSKIARCCRRRSRRSFDSKHPRRFRPDRAP